MNPDSSSNGVDLPSKALPFQQRNQNGTDGRMGGFLFTVWFMPGEKHITIASSAVTFSAYRPRLSQDECI